MCFLLIPNLGSIFSIADHIGCGCLLLILETQMDGLSPSQGTRSIPLCMVDHATLIEATGQGIGWMDWTTAICYWCYWYHLMAHIGLSMARTNQTKLSNPADMLSKIVSVQSCGRSFFTSDYKRLYLAYSLMCSLGTFLDGNPCLSKYELAKHVWIRLFLSNVISTDHVYVLAEKLIAFWTDEVLPKHQVLGVVHIMTAKNALPRQMHQWNPPTRWFSCMFTQIAHHTGTVLAPTRCERIWKVPRFLSRLDLRVVVEDARLF